MVGITRDDPPTIAQNLDNSDGIGLIRTGLSGPIEPSVSDGITPEERPATMAWISDELLNATIDVWSRNYGREITHDEAMDILGNVKRFGEMLVRAKEEA